MNKTYRRVGAGVLAAIGCYALLPALGALFQMGLNALASYLVGVWGVNQANVARAPGWLRALYPNLAPILSILNGLMLCAVAMLGARCVLRERMWVAPKSRALPAMMRWAGVGAGLALIAAALLIAIDSMRLAMPVSSPRISASVFVLIAYQFVAVFSEEAFFRFLAGRALQKGLSPWPARIASALLYAAYVAAFEQLNVFSVLNAALTGLLLMLLMERTGSFLSGVGFRFGFLLIQGCVLGMAGGRMLGVATLYEVYPVSELWLSGGQDLMSGILLTAPLAALCYRLSRGGHDSSRPRS